MKPFTRLNYMEYSKKIKFEIYFLSVLVLPKCYDAKSHRHEIMS